MRIPDLAQALIALLASAYGLDSQKIPTRFVGARSGEKLYEELLTAEEMSRALETEHMFAILPSFQGIHRKVQYSYRGRVERASLHRQYISSQEPPLTMQEIKSLLSTNNILEDLVQGDQKIDQLSHQGHLRLVSEGRLGVGVN
jgi:FlaA1/EpsC-like NDP-sugar epimerase